MMRFKRSSFFSPPRRGNVAAIVAVLMPVIIGVSALGLDAGLLFVQRRQAQTAAEAASLAGAYALYNNSNFSVAQSWAAAAGTQNGIVVTSAQVTEPQANYIAVSATSTQPRTFSALWGQGTMSATASATSRSASASASPYSGYSILALSKTAPSGLFITGSAKLTALGGGVQVNSNAAAVAYTSSAFYVGNMGSITAPSIAVVGTTWLQPNGVGTVSPSTPSVGSVVADPLANASPPISPPTLSSAQAQGTYPNFSTANGANVTMNQGYYPNGVNIGYSTVKMNPGTYYIAGGNFYVANAATLSGTGVTIYLSSTASTNNGTSPVSNAAVSIQSATSVVLSAPSSGTYKGILFYVDPANSSGVQFGNNQTTLNLTGTIYAPSSLVDVTGYSSQALYVGSQIIANTVRVENNAQVTVSYNKSNVAGSVSSSSLALVK